MDFIPVCSPALEGKELEYITDAVSTGWISSAGKYVKAFEEKFAEYCAARYAVSICNGTVALHLALVTLGIKAGDEVIIPSFTMIASAFAVCYTGAIPVFVDAEPLSWNINPNLIEQKISPRTRAIMPVSIFGHPCDMEKISNLAKKYNLYVIEDAAESVGAEYKGIKTGNLADITTFSFFANKNITTGEGGMLVTNNEEFYKKALYYKNLCFALDSTRNYIHNDIGFNYRMSNIHAAIGLAQVEKADHYRNLRIRNAVLYALFLKNISGITLQSTLPDVLNVHWMNGIVIDELEYGKTRDELMRYLKEKNIDSRLFFVGMHKQLALKKYGCRCDEEYPVADYLTAKGFYLPSGSNLKESEIEYICSVIKEFRSK